MKIEKISDSKIKITLSQHELDERNIDFSAIAQNAPEAQELFWDMMLQAEVEYGFSTSDSQIFVEAASSGSTFVITISKLAELDKYFKYTTPTKANLKVKKKDLKIILDPKIYVFDSFEQLCELCSALKSNYLGENCLFKYKDKYYLVFSRITTNNPSFANTNILLAEYGQKVRNAVLFEGILNEHGTRVIEKNALQTLVKYFN